MAACTRARHHRCLHEMRRTSLEPHKKRYQGLPPGVGDPEGGLVYVRDPLVLCCTMSTCGLFEARCLPDIHTGFTEKGKAVVFFHWDISCPLNVLPRLP